ncbi:DUF3761 domain-containing protein [Citrobacter braakii]|uniref:DUF3761 domain-containing protein n=1 Tax=Enterobacteriaceae TaxID=543 RepID=UPI00299F89C1|nr:DUF3761 domain-containing protein [Enterobacter hormaechei]
MNSIPLTLLTCTLLWSAASIAASPAKKDVPETTNMQTQDVSTPKKIHRLHAKHKAGGITPQKANTSQARTARDSNGKFLKKGGSGTAPKALAEGGATARCQDGTLSHSKQHSGACSRHGGVTQWLSE